MRLMTVFSSDEIRKMGIDVIVEGWHHAVGNGSAGRVRRAYQAEFTEEERKKLGELYRTKLYPWTMRTGIPDEVEMTLATRDLIIRAANFFASI